jgi:hypothetical protein
MRPVLLLLTAAVAACASAKTPSPSADAATDTSADATPRVPKFHRATATACPTDRPPGHVEPASTGACAKDADCTTGKNGRCWGGLVPNTCTYDECTADADCPSAVCDCRNDAHLGQPNVCFKGNCRTDADCKGDYCSPSAVHVGFDCIGVPIGSWGYFCHTATDECVDDADCGAAGKQCIFDVEVVHWKCMQPACPG